MNAVTRLLMQMFYKEQESEVISPLSNEHHWRVILQEPTKDYWEDFCSNNPDDKHCRIYDV